MVKLHYVVLAAIAVAFLAPLPTLGNIILPNLPAGSEYELVFVTRGARDATTPYIADYNSFVIAQALQNPNLPQGITWNAIASAAGDIHGFGMMDACQNAPFSASIPVYNTAGQLVANAPTPLYNANGTLINAIGYDQFGNAWISVVWTGSNVDGTSDRPLGGQSEYGMPQRGESAYKGRDNPGNLDDTWLSGGFDSQIFACPLYALSSPITVTAPEPGTLTLLTAGTIALGACALRRRWMKAA